MPTCICTYVLLLLCTYNFIPQYPATLLVLLGLVIIESVSYLIRILSLGVRLAANITAGHLLLAIISGFVWEMVINEWLFLGLGCSLILILVVVLEVKVAFIQVYVFCLLTIIYFKDAYELH